MEFGQAMIMAKKGKHADRRNTTIYLLSIIGEIEGHECLPSTSKTTKYEHVLPRLAAIEDDESVNGVLLLLNTMGGDVESGLAIAEMVASLSKPTVSLVLGGSHSIGVPLAVSTDYSFIVPSGTMVISGTVIGAKQTYDYFKQMQDRISESSETVLLTLSGLSEIKTGKTDEPYLRIVNSSYRKLVVLIIVSTIPTGIIGVVGKDVVEMASEILLIPGICLILTAVLLFIADHTRDGEKLPKSVTYTKCIWSRNSQGIATLPGLSRSGTTITACLLSGFNRNFAVKYSFLMSIPAILGALVLELKDCTAVALSGAEILHIM